MKRRRKPRGIALILALLTTVILVTLSLAFMSLSLSEARTSRSYSFEETSIQAASFGLEYALVYMGHGTSVQPPALSTWKLRNWPNPSNAADLNFGFYNVLEAQPAAVTSSDLLVKVEDYHQDSSLLKLVPGNLSPTEQDRVRDDLRRLTLVVPGGAARLIPLSDELAFVTDVVIEPILVARNQGRSDYRLVSTAKVYQMSPGVAPSAAQQPVATRVVEARVKESSFDYAHFISNGRTWNVNGITPATSPKTVDPNNPDASIDLADYVYIPNAYKEEGPMRVDGQPPVGAGASAAYQRVVQNSGNLNFLPGADTPGNVDFTHKLTINQPKNVFLDPNITDATMPGFTAGMTPLASRVGIPDFRRDDMILASKLKINDTDKSGFYEIKTSEIPGAVPVALGGLPAPRSTDPLGPFYDGTEPVTIGGQVFQVPKPYDYRPRVPNTEITLSKDRIKVVKRNTSTNAVLSTEEFSQSQLQMGLIYVEGGNVVIKTEGNVDSTTGKFQGKLSIVAGERPGRDGFTPSAESVYSQTAREVYNYEKKLWDNATKLGQNPVAANFKTPPYTVAQMRVIQAEAPLNITTPIEAGLGDNQPMWPAPEVEVSATGAKKYKVEREGNVVIADDVVYDKNAGNSLGLFAQNFVLLNDTTPSPTLNIDAVLMSAERSVSLDWDNTGRQDETSWKAMMKPPGPNEVDRTVNINGSIIGEYIDVEGDALHRGYYHQNFKYDLALRNANPPFMPRLNLAQLSGGFRFMILHYLDRGSLTAAGLLP